MIGLDALFRRNSGFPGGSVVKNLPANVEGMSLITGSGRSPGEGNGNLLQYSCLENPMDGEAWWATVHRAAESWTQLSTFFLLLSFLAVHLSL